MPLSRPEYVRRALIAVGLAFAAVVLFMLLRLATGVLLVLFAGVLLAVFLDGLARWLVRHTLLPRLAALGIVLVALMASAVGMGWLLGARVVDQMVILSEQLPETLAGIEAWLAQYGWGSAVIERVPSTPGEMLPDSGAMGMLTSALSRILGVLANVLIVVFVGLYLAFNPSLYLGALVRLAPLRHRARADEVFAALGRALRYWLVGRIISMLIVGVLTALGLFLFGIPLALALGVLAAALTFIPYIGPILALVPALAVALPAGEVGTVLGIYLAVQILESYLITPLVQKQAISMPPALLITAQLLLGVSVGIFGVAVATPLAVIAIVLVQMLYVEDALDDHGIEVIGNSD